MDEKMSTDERSIYEAIKGRRILSGGYYLEWEWATPGLIVAVVDSEGEDVPGLCDILQTMWVLEAVQWAEDMLQNENRI